jgi:hypothetical protein
MEVIDQNGDWGNGKILNGIDVVLSSKWTFCVRLEDRSKSWDYNSPTSRRPQ